MRLFRWRAVNEEAFDLIVIPPVKEKGLIVRDAMAVCQGQPTTKVPHSGRDARRVIGQVKFGANGNRHGHSFRRRLGEFDFEAFTDKFRVIFTVTNDFRFRQHLTRSLYGFDPAFQLRPRCLIAQIQGHFDHGPIMPERIA